MPLRIDAWPHYPSPRGTIPSGGDPANPSGWQDNLDKIQATVNDHTHVIPMDRTWAIPGDLTTGMYVVPFFIPSTVSSATLKGLLLDLESGTSVTCNLTLKPWNGTEVDMVAPYHSFIVTPTDSEVTGDVVLSPKDKLRLVIQGAVGGPKNLTVTLSLNYVSGG